MIFMNFKMKKKNTKLMNVNVRLSKTKVQGKQTFQHDLKCNSLQIFSCSKFRMNKHINGSKTADGMSTFCEISCILPRESGPSHHHGVDRSLLLSPKRDSQNINKFRGIAVLNVMAMSKTNYLLVNSYIDISCQRTGVPGISAVRCTHLWSGNNSAMQITVDVCLLSSSISL